MPVTAGHSTTISVTLTDASTGEGLEASFHLYYSIDGGATWTELGMGILGQGSLWTDEDGEFSSSWSPGGHLPHDYLLRARWEGNEVYDSCMVIEPLTVNLPSDVPLVISNVCDFVSGSTYYVAGEIENTGSENLESVKVAVGYYDSTGNIIDAEISSIPIDILMPNHVSPFVFKRTVAAEVARYEVVVSRFSTTEEEPYMDFECSNHRLKTGTNDRVVGLVRNTGSMNARFVKVYVIFYDASGRPIGDGYSSVYRNMLKPGEVSPFSVYGDNVEAPDHYTLIFQSDTTTDQPYTYVQPVSHSGQKSGNSYTISGEVTNTGFSCVDDVEVIAALYDVDGNILDCSVDFLDYSMIPDQSLEFEVSAYIGTDNIDHYELWVDCTENAYWFDVEDVWNIFITTNSSSVYSLNFDRNVKTISFDVSGYSGVGWCRAVVPKELLGGPFTVLVDGATVTHTQTENATHNFFSFTYQHSLHTVEIVGTTVIEEPSFIYCSVEPTSTTYGDVSVEISGYITPLVDETKSVPVTIQYSTDSVTWLDVTTVTSSSQASYQYVWSPTLDVGTYYLRATWDGLASYTGATSETATFLVNPVSTTISISLSETSVTEGDEVTVSGTIEPPEQVSITLTYTLPDGSTLTRTATSSSDGSFSDTFEPTVTGSWSVQASWTGSESQEGTTSSTKSFTVSGTETGDGTENGDGTETADGTENGDGGETVDGTEEGDGTENGDGAETVDGTENGDGTPTADGIEDEEVFAIPLLWMVILVVVVLVIIIVALVAVILSRSKK